MKKPTLYAPARPGLAIPMPDRGNRLMPESGVAVDAASPFYRRLIADGDIAPVKAKPATEPIADKRGKTSKRG